MNGTDDRTGRDARRELLLRLLARQDEPPGPVPRVPGEPLPAAAIQRRLWLHAASLPDPAVYALPLAVRLRGHLRLDALRRALDAVVERHEVLRTAFLDRGGELTQRIDDTVTVPVHRSDLTAVAPEDRDAALERALHAEIGRPFDLGRAPLLRCHVFALGSAEHVLLLTAHHLVADGWSAGVLWRDLDACYRAATAGHAAALPPLPLQYADFACWQRARLDYGGDRTHDEFWRRHLDDAPAAIDLSPARSGTGDGRGATAEFQPPPALGGAVRELGRRNGCTLFSVLLAGFFALLRRFSGAEDIVIGVPAAARRSEAVQQLIGYFVNLLPVRVRVRSDMPFTGLVTATAHALAGAMAHQELPVDWLAAPRVSFSLTETSRQAGRLGDLGLEPVYLPGRTSKFDLTLAIVDDGTELRGAWEYRTDLFRPWTARLWTERLCTVLAAAVAAPDRPVGGLPVLGPAERDLLRRASRIASCTGAGAATSSAVAAERPRREEDR